jgi:threonyl-tRNA synthetase
MKDHAELGKELDLFCHAPAVGKGLPLLTPRGSAVLRVLKRFVEDEEIRRGYGYTATPFMAGEDLYRVSGHWDLYRENMFLIPDREAAGAGPDDHAEGRYLALRPMTCPFQFQVYLRKKHSYRDLPVRYAETSSLFRNEATGALHGLVRIRQFTLSEGHIICRPDQVEEEFLAALDLVRFVMGSIGVDGFWYRFSTRGDAPGGKYIDDPAAWADSQDRLRRLLDRTGERYVEAPGEAAFYGPKLDIQARDAWGREETLFTLQLDFALPRRFGMVYADADGEDRHPMVIHRSSIGCYERTLALLLERYQGRLPFWMAPEQLRLMTVGGEASAAFAGELRRELMALGLRAELDLRGETLGRKIQDARGLLVPVLAVIGEREAAEGRVSLRLLEGNGQAVLGKAEFLDWCAALDRSRALQVELPPGVRGSAASPARG